MAFLTHPKGPNTKTSISKRAEPGNQSASVFLPKSSNTHLFSQPQSICKTGIRCSAPPCSRRPGNAQFSPTTLENLEGQHLNGCPTCRGSLCPVNQVTLAVQQGDAVQDRRESRSSLPIHFCPVRPRARARPSTRPGYSRPGGRPETRKRKKKKKAGCAKTLLR